MFVPGSGQYGIQPIHVEDYADLALAQGRSGENIVLDAVGPEAPSFEALIRLVAEKIGRPARLLHVSPALALWASGVVGRIVGDVVLTREEVLGLLDGLLVSSEPPTGRTRLSEWLGENARSIGVEYASEIARHFR